MTTITPNPGNQPAPRPSLRSMGGEPGTLTAVPQADQSQNPQTGVPVTYPGPPRPVQVTATRLADLADQLGVPALQEPSASTGSTGITHDSRAVRPGDIYAALPGARFHGADFAAQAASLGAVAALTDPSGAERVAAAGLLYPRRGEPARPDGRAGGHDLRPPRPRSAPDRHHGHVRQDHDGLPHRGRAAHDAQHRTHRHRRDAHRRRAHQVRAHHPRSHRPPGAVRGDARARCGRGRDGGLQSRPRARPGRRLRLRRGGLQQPQPGTHGVPLRHGGLLPGQGTAVHARTQQTGRRELRRRVRPPASSPSPKCPS